MFAMSLDTYTDPVKGLLTLGADNLSLNDEWPDYLAQFGLTSAHIPQLIQLATDTQFETMDSERDEIWAPIYAVRALGQLQAEDAIAPLLDLLQRDDEYFDINVPQALGMIGEAALAPTVELANDEEQDTFVRGATIAALGYLGKYHPESRDATVAALMGLLENPGDRPNLVLTYAVSELIDLKATEAAPLIEQAFALGKIDEWVTGNWAMVQISLGLKNESDFSPEELQIEPPPYIKQLRSMVKQMNRQANPPKGFGTSSSVNPKKKKKRKK